MSLYKNYNDLVESLEIQEIKVNLAEAMKQSFLLYYRVMFFLLREQNLTLKPHIVYLARELEDSYRNITNTAIFAPPGCGKTAIKQFFIAWTLTVQKETKWIYTNSVATETDRRASEIRDILFNRFSYKLFGLEVDLSMGSKGNFVVRGASKRSGFATKSFAANMVGGDGGNTAIPFGCTGGVNVDDPNDVSLLHSETMRTRSKAQFQSFSQRLRDRGMLLLDMQRLHVDDVGSLVIEQNESGVRPWKIITIPALDENDNSLWEENDQLKRKRLINLRESVNPSDVELYWSQYQQKPIVSGGSIIKEEWLGRYSDLTYKDTIRKIFMTCDTAYSSKKSADYTVMCVWATDDKYLYLLDMVRGRYDFDQLKPKAVELWHYYTVNPIGRLSTTVSVFYIENKAVGQPLIQQLSKDTPMNVKPVERSVGKLQRLENKPNDKLLGLERVIDYIASGKVLLPLSKPDVTKVFVSECMAFTRDNTHKHDDIVDNLIDGVTIGLVSRHNVWASLSSKQTQTPELAITVPQTRKRK